MPRLTLNRAPATMDGRRVSLSGEVTADYACTLGATAEPDRTAGMLIALPGARYTRDYGTRDGANLTVHGTGKLALMPAGSIVHVSWKGDVNQLDEWLRHAPGHLLYYVTWYHEPADNMDHVEHMTSASLVPAIIDASPMRHLVLGNGPCLTRWNLLGQSIDPALWLYPGATHLFADTYNQNSTRYLSPEEQFGPIAEAARALGVRWGVPEYGMRLLAADTTGSGRAATIRAHYAWLSAQEDLDCVGWLDIGGCRLSNRLSYPDGAALREVLT